LSFTVFTAWASCAMAGLMPASASWAWLEGIGQVDIGTLIARKHIPRLNQLDGRF
jgi:hypothetical protein